MKPWPPVESCPCVTMIKYVFLKLSKKVRTNLGSSTAPRWIWDNTLILLFFLKYFKNLCCKIMKTNTSAYNRSILTCQSWTWGSNSLSFVVSFRINISLSLILVDRLQIARFCGRCAGLCAKFCLYCILLTWTQKLYKQQPVVTKHHQILLEWCRDTAMITDL